MGSQVLVLLLGRASPAVCLDLPPLARGKLPRRWPALCRCMVVAVLVDNSAFWRLTVRRRYFYVESVLLVEHVPRPRHCVYKGRAIDSKVGTLFKVYSR